MQADNTQYTHNSYVSIHEYRMVNLDEDLNKYRNYES
jgi:hypothetical protein